MSENEAEAKAEAGTFPAYDAEDIEAKWQRAWEEEGLYRTGEDPTKPRGMCSRCSRIPRATCTWVMPATTPSAMRWRGMPA